MPHNAAFSLARLYGPAGPVKDSLRRASPALDRACGTIPRRLITHSNFKRGKILRRVKEIVARATIASSDETPTPSHQPCQPGVFGLLGANPVQWHAIEQ